MMRARRAVAAVTLALGLTVAAPSSGQENTQALRQEIDQLRREFEALKQDYGQRLAALEAKMAAAEGAPAQTPPAPAAEPGAAQPTAQVPPGAAGAGGPAGSLPVYGAQALTSKIFNPDIAVIGDFLGAAGPNAIAPQPGLEMHESEASFQAVVDPYARADFFMSFGEEGVDLEEGYVTFTSLPGGLLTRAGKMRAAFGKVNTFHTHVLPWVDRPMVTENLLGGEDGINDAGLSVTRILPSPKGLFLEATGQLFRGDSADVFRANQRSHVSAVAHLRGYGDLSESTNLDIGLSYSRGHNDVAGLFNACTVCGGATLPDRFVTNLYGVDATLRWKPLRRAIYRSFTARSEFVWSQRQQPGNFSLVPGEAAGTQRAFGYYVAGEYQFARRWFAGARFDRSDQARHAARTDNGGSLMLTYWPTEFTQIRGQYRTTRYAGSSQNTNEFRLQVQFSLGAHGAHPF
jgi:hypothetical protein